MTINKIKAENELFAGKKQELENRKEMILKDDERSEKYKQEQTQIIKNNIADLINEKEPLIAEMIETEKKELKEKLANVSYELSADDVQKEILKELRVARVSSELVSRYKDKNVTGLVERAKKEVENNSLEALAYIHAMKLLDVNPLTIEQLEQMYMEYTLPKEVKTIKEELNELENELERFKITVYGDPFENAMKKVKAVR